MFPVNDNGIASLTPWLQAVGLSVHLYSRAVGNRASDSGLSHLVALTSLQHRPVAVPVPQPNQKGVLS